MYRGRLDAFDLGEGTRGDDAIAFSRVELRHRRRKVVGDCGHAIDGSAGRLSPYRYQVWKISGTAGVRQRIDCESCARGDDPAWRR